MTDTNALHPYAELTPDRVMDALTDLGLWPDGRLLALSSYENRVYRAHLDEPVQGASAVVLKFYRPGRWSRVQIQEEHDFAAELVAAEVPVVAPMTLNGQTLHQRQALIFRSALCAVVARRSWMISRCWSGLAAFWPASTPWARPSPLRTGPRLMCRPLRWSLPNGCKPIR